MSLTDIATERHRLRSVALKQVFAEVILGRPSAGCRHFGICEIRSIIPNDFRQQTPGFCGSSRKVYALASLKPAAFIELAFLRSSIDPVVFKEHFEKGTFSVEENYKAGMDFMGLLVCFKQGNYPIKFSETLLTVQFELC